MKSELAALKKFQRQFSQHIRHPKRFHKPSQVPQDRMSVYSRLIFNSMEDVLSGCFPFCKEALGKINWLKLLRDFFSTHSCQRPFYRQVPEEFIDYLSVKSRKNFPSYLPHLAHFEWLELDLYVSEKVNTLRFSEDLGEGKIVFTQPCQLVTYPYPVHLIRKGYKSKTRTEDCYYLFYRDAALDVKWMLLNPAQAKLIHLLLNKKMLLSKALKKIAAELKLPINFVKHSALENLQSFQQKGIILGTLSLYTFNT